MATVEGLDRLRAKLRRMPDKARVRIHGALVKNADELVSAQKALAQRSRHTGTLIDSIERHDGEHDLQQFVGAGAGDAFYARFVEFGTVNTPAQPFFWPAFRLLRKKFKTRVRSAVSKSVKEAARGQ